MESHSSTLAWKIPWTEEPGRLHTVHRVTKSWTLLNMQASVVKPGKILIIVRKLIKVAGKQRIYDSLVPLSTSNK